MADRERLICASSALVEGGDGVRFECPGPGGGEPAFVVRYAGRPHAYLNRCAHVPVELDWMPGRLFDLTGHYLVCAMHGAHYEAWSGLCTMGPCKGARLRRLEIVEHDGGVYLCLPSGGDG